MSAAGVKMLTVRMSSPGIDGADLADARFSDGSVVTAPVGSYHPNAWGFHDMHGNAWEWTSSVRSGSPEDNSRERVALGGSFFDRPERCRLSVQVSYPEWQRVFNVGFRVVSNDDLGSRKE